MLAELFRARRAYFWASLCKGTLSNLIKLGILFTTDVKGISQGGCGVMCLCHRSSVRFLTMVLVKFPWCKHAYSSIQIDKRSNFTTGFYYLMTSMVTSS